MTTLAELKKEYKNTKNDFNRLLSDLSDFSKVHEGRDWRFTEAAYAISHNLNRGILTGSDEMTFRAMTTHQLLKFILSLAQYAEKQSYKCLNDYKVNIFGMRNMGRPESFVNSKGLFFNPFEK